VLYLASSGVANGSIYAGGAWPTMRSPYLQLTRRQTCKGFLAGISYVPLGGASQAIEPNRSSLRSDAADPIWLTLPPTPTLPRAPRSGVVSINDARIFFAQFGEGPPVLLLHGGLASSSYWGHQVRELSKKFSVTVMDTRGHGRSPVTSSAFSYVLFADDVARLLDILKISAVSIVGWSDGAITGLQLAISQPDRISKLFAFGANSSVSGLKKHGSKSPVFQAFAERCKAEYAITSPSPEKWSQLLHGLRPMWRTQPEFTKQMLASIKVPAAVSDGEYDELILREETERMAREIPSARLIILPDVSHFAMLQNPAQFTAVLTKFLTS
jgi:pimeloyl-ACP methyl ester carboxylesterase